MAIAASGSGNRYMYVQIMSVSDLGEEIIVGIMPMEKERAGYDCKGWLIGSLPLSHIHDSISLGTSTREQSKVERINVVV
jgi:hypothetical protein